MFFGSMGRWCDRSVDKAVRHVLMRQGVLGIRVSIMLPWDPEGKMGPKIPMPDVVTIYEPKEDVVPLPKPSAADE